MYQYFLLDFNAGSLELMGGFAGLTATIILSIKLFITGFLYEQYATPARPVCSLFYQLSQYNCSSIFILRLDTATTFKAIKKQVMKYLTFIVPLATGLILGVAQYTSRLFLINKNLPESLLLGGVTATLYLVAVVQWAKVLKSPLNLSGAYAIVVLGVFIGILTMNHFGSQKNTSISVQDVAGIMLIAVGSALIRR